MIELNQKRVMTEEHWLFRKGEVVWIMEKEGDISTWTNGEKYCYNSNYIIEECSRPITKLERVLK